jgi:hypothetical protein
MQKKSLMPLLMITLAGPLLAQYGAPDGQWHT